MSKRVFIGSPSHSGQWCGEFVGGIYSIAQHIGQLNMPSTCADIRLVRATIVNEFLLGDLPDLFFIDSDIGFTSEDFYMVMNNTESLVIGEYPKKVEPPATVKLGLGFCKISRDVFAKLDALNSEDGSPFIDSFMWKGGLVRDYFLSGSMSGQYYTEDAGFFGVCRMANIVPKFENLLQLSHTGLKTWRANI